MTGSPAVPPTPTGEPRMCGYRLVFDKSIPLGEARIVSAQGDTIATLDLIHGGYTLHPAPMRAQAKEWSGPLLLERPLPSSSDSSPADTLSPNWTPTSVAEARREVETGNLHPMRHDVFCAKVDVLIAAVRAEDRQKVNRLRTAAETLVRTWSRYPQNEHESLAMHELKESLAGLAKMEGK